MGLLDFLKSPKSIELDALVVEGTGRFDVEVRGESHYQNALLAAVGGKPRDRIRAQVQAGLIPEPSNTQDRNAVMVYVGGRKVGYLAADQAVKYRECFERLVAKKMALACQAIIVGGGRDENGRTRMLGVWLDLPTPRQLTSEID